MWAIQAGPAIMRRALGSGIAYWLRATFTNDVPAPMTSPYVADIGQLTLVDPASQLSVSTGKLQIAGGSGAAWDRGYYSTDGKPRIAGRALVAAVTQASGSAFGPLVWSRSAAIVNPTIAGNADHGIRANAGSFWVYINGVVTVQRAAPLGTDLAVVLRAVGGFYLQKVAGVWILEWVDNAQNTATLFPVMSNFNGVGTLDNVTGVDFGGDWSTAYGIATNRIAITANGEITTQIANAIVEHTITAATGVTQELMIRRTDDNNCWIVRMDQTGSTIKLFQKQAGVETERATAAQTFTNGVQYRVVAVCFSNTIELYVANVAKGLYASATFNNTATGVKVSHAGVDLVAWPRFPIVPNF